MPGTARALSPWLGAFSFYSIVAVIVTWPVVRAAGAVVSQPAGDPLLNIWILWWDLQQAPLTPAWWNAPMFYPTPGTMAFSELLIGLLPTTAPVHWIFGNPVLAYNAAVILSFPLSALAAHALGFELTGRHDAALLAGLAFGFMAYRGGEFGHVQMLSYYWAPMALFALHRYARTRRVAWLAGCSAACLLQVLCNGYSLFHLPVLVGLWMLWFCRSARDAFRITVAAVPIGLALLPILAKYREVHASLHLTRSIADLRTFSADIAGLVSVPPESLLYGNLLTSHQASGLFPGITVVAILIAGIVHAARRRTTRRRHPGSMRRLFAAVAVVCAGAAASVWVFGPWSISRLTVSDGYKPLSLAVVAAVAYFALGPGWRRVWRERSVTGFYALAAATFYVLSFGPEPRLFGHRVFYKAPYAWLMELPGFDAIRSPARFAMLGVLCVAVLAALIYARWMAVPPASRRWMWMPLGAGLIAEGLLNVGVARVPEAGPSHSWPGVSAVIELPFSPDRDAAALYRSMSYGVPIVNGTSGYAPPHYAALTYALARGETAVIDELAAYGSVGIAIDRSAPEHRSIEESVRARADVTAIADTAAWASFVRPALKIARPPPGRSIALRVVRANRNSGQLGHLIDGDIRTTWASWPQAGDEEIVAELGDRRDVGAVTLRLGPCPFAFPRDLSIETSLDGANWTERWRGGTAVATVRGALASPSEVPVVMTFPPAAARFVRLRQLGRDDRVPWCIAELSVHR